MIDGSFAGDAGGGGGFGSFGLRLYLSVHANAKC